MQLQMQRVNLDVLLLTWLTLNDEPPQDENGATSSASSIQSGFDPTRVPSIPLSQNALSSLLGALAWTPVIPVRTWVLAFQALSLLCNLRCTQDEVSSVTGRRERWLASVMVLDANLMSVLSKFLSCAAAQGPTATVQQFTQVRV